ncbi:PfkB family carbohydrate kinase [uncultured Desulfobacter sp.]|uniref:PfkB family carbohydrate kinase n=1 Tax=uncultured Desulfobacter sp. TaxID=240139 RepID=UPI002AAB12AB|nr:PfkB family carbohydrate kinase [uncultured Desulfobacter sp.]
MTHRQIIVFGEVLFDCFPDGQRVLGGAPFNVAWHLQAFGAAPLFISSVGQDSSGEQVKNAMAGWGMDLNGLQTHGCQPTGQVDVTIAGNEPCYDIVSPCAYDYIQSGQLPGLPDRPILYHGTVAIRNPVSADTLRAIKCRTKPYVFLDVNLRAPWWRVTDIIPLLADTSWLKLNHHELTELVPDCKDGQSRINKLFSSTSVKYITLTHGEKGAVLHSADGSPPIFVSPEKTMSVIDTVGAGDAFSSVLLLGKIRHWDFQTTLKRAQEFAGAVVAIRGATTTDDTFYQQFLNAWE